MNHTDFIEHVEALFKTAGFNTDPKALALVHAAVGISGEAGELLDAIKKHWAYNKELDITNVVEEIGDLLFYTQALMLQLGINWREVFEHNYEKLKARYPEGYTDSHAQLRLDKTGDSNVSSDPAINYLNASHNTGCQHKWVYIGHGHDFSSWKCTKCGIEGDY